MNPRRDVDDWVVLVWELDERGADEHSLGLLILLCFAFFLLLLCLSLESRIVVLEPELASLGPTAGVDSPIGSKEDRVVLTTRNLDDCRTPQLMLAQPEHSAWQEHFALARPCLCHVVQAPSPNVTTLIYSEGCVVPSTDQYCPMCPDPRAQHDLFGYGTVDLAALHNFPSELALLTCSPCVEGARRGENEQVIVTGGYGSELFRSFKGQNRSGQELVFKTTREAENAFDAL